MPPFQTGDLTQSWNAIFSLFTNILNTLFNSLKFSIGSYSLSIGWLLIGGFIFLLLLRFLLAIPRMPVKNKAVKDDTKEQSNEN